MYLLSEILKEIQNAYDKFPLNVLVKHAKHFQDFDAFSKFYTINIGHGYYWHITEDPNFTPNPDVAPRDMSSMSDGGGTDKGLMVTSDIDNWIGNYKKTRPYAALLDTSNLDPKYLKQVSRGFGNEIFIPASELSKIKVIGIYKINSVLAKERKLFKMIPQSERELKQLFNFAHGKN